MSNVKCKLRLYYTTLALYRKRHGGLPKKGALKRQQKKGLIFLKAAARCSRSFLFCSTEVSTVSSIML